jgi:GT2 family glycosyltransferase
MNKRENSWPVALPAALLPERIFWSPERSVFSAWTQHVPFAFWLAGALRPSVLVELGTFSGMSYCAFCQAVDRLGLATRAHAVDTWAGDEHGGSYGEEVFQSLGAHNAARYAGFSTLVRATFDQAVAGFGDGSIDLLHIDGLHTYEAVRHDFETWRAKLAPGAVVLFHDTNVRDRGFGVWRFWQEVRSLGPSFEFLHGNGLGILSLGAPHTPELQALFDTGSDESALAAVRTVFARLGAGIEDRMYRDEYRAGVEYRDRQIAHREQQLAALGERGAELARTLARAAAVEPLEADAEPRERLDSALGLAERVATLLDRSRLECDELARDRASQAGIIDRQAARLGELEIQLVARLGELAHQGGELSAARRQADQVSSERQVLYERLVQLDEALGRARTEADALRASLSWRATRPLRALTRRLPWLARGARAAGRRARSLVTAPASAASPAVDLEGLLSWSQLFDEVWYRRQAVVGEPGRLAAVRHFLAYGSAADLDPHPLFSTRWYREHHGAALPGGMAPLVHYLLEGHAEKRSTHPLFDPAYYESRGAPLPYRADPLVHFLESAERDPHPLFNCAWYRAQAGAACEINPLLHFVTQGAEKMLDPHPLFDVSWYLEHHPEVAAAGRNPLEDFLARATHADLDPHPLFDSSWYLQSNPDVCESRVNPLIHYVLQGGRELRRPAADFDARFVASFSRAALERGESPLEAHVRRHGAVPLRDALAAADPTARFARTRLLPARVAVGVVVHNNPPEEVRRLAASLRLPPGAPELLTVSRYLLSNGAGEYSTLAQELGFTLFDRQPNRGFGAGHNTLMRRAFDDGADYYIAANPDGFFAPDCIEQLVRACRHFGDRALVEAVQFPEEHTKSFDPETLDTPWVSGACLLVSRVAWQALGGFDERMFMYCEDVDLSWRALEAGLGVKHCPTALYYHDVTERDGQDWRARQMYLAGRYMAYKWGAPGFARKLEDDLVRWGLIERLEDLEPLAEEFAGRVAPPYADFSRAFYFAAPRWD